MVRPPAAIAVPRIQPVNHILKLKDDSGIPWEHKKRSPLYPECLQIFGKLSFTIPIRMNISYIRK